MYWHLLVWVSLKDSPNIDTMLTSKEVMEGIISNGLLYFIFRFSGTNFRYTSILILSVYLYNTLLKKDQQVSRYGS